MRAASATGDISKIMSIISSTSKLKPADYIKKTVGQLRFLYYLYLERFKSKPLDILDLIDGLLYIKARNYQDKLIKESIDAQARSSRK